MATNEIAQTPDTTTVTTTTAQPTLPASAEPLVITVANTTERKQLPEARTATVGQLVSTSLALATGTTAALSFVALLAPLQAPITGFAVVGASLLGLGIKSAYKGKLGLTETLVVASVVVGASAAALDLRAQPQQAPASVYSRSQPTAQEPPLTRKENTRQLQKGQSK